MCGIPTPPHPCPRASRDGQQHLAQPLPPGKQAAAARHDWHVYPEAGAAGLWTSPQDLARFACALQAALALRPSGVRPEVAAQLLAPHARLPAKGEWNVIAVVEAGEQADNERFRRQLEG